MDKSINMLELIFTYPKGQLNLFIHIALVDNFRMFVEIGNQFVVGYMHADFAFRVIAVNLLGNNLLEA